MYINIYIYLFKNICRRVKIQQHLKKLNATSTNGLRHVTAAHPTLTTAPLGAAENRRNKLSPVLNKLSTS